MDPTSPEEGERTDDDRQSASHSRTSREYSRERFRERRDYEFQEYGKSEFEDYKQPLDSREYDRYEPRQRRDYPPTIDRYQEPRDYPRMDDRYLETREYESRRFERRDYGRMEDRDFRDRQNFERRPVYPYPPYRNERPPIRPEYRGPYRDERRPFRGFRGEERPPFRESRPPPRDYRPQYRPGYRYDPPPRDPRDHDGRGWKAQHEDEPYGRRDDFRPRSPYQERNRSYDYSEEHFNRMPNYRPRPPLDPRYERRDSRDFDDRPRPRESFRKASIDFEVPEINKSPERRDRYSGRHPHPKTSPIEIDRTESNTQINTNPSEANIIAAGYIETERDILWKEQIDIMMEMKRTAFDINRAEWDIEKFNQLAQVE